MLLLRSGEDRISDRKIPTTPGKGTEIAKGSEPNPVFANRGNLQSSNMLATGTESFQASSQSLGIPLDGHKEHMESKIKRRS